MAAARSASTEPRIIAAADAALVARLRPLVPHAQMLETTLATLLVDVTRQRPKVVLCASSEVGEGAGGGDPGAVGRAGGWGGRRAGDARR